MSTMRLDLKVGWDCNNNCVQCPTAKRKSDSATQEFTLDALKQIILQNKHCSQFTITGGEPTIRNDLDEICHFIKEICNAKIILQTNGRRLGDEQYLKALEPFIDDFFVSFHSFSKNHHNKTTGQPESWDETIHGIIHLLNNFPHKLITHTVVTKINLETLAKTFDFLHQIGVGRRALSFPHPAENAYKYFGLVIPSLTEVKSVLDYIIKNYSDGLLINDFPACYLHPYRKHVEAALNSYKPISFQDDVCIEPLNGIQIKTANEIIAECMAKSEKCLKCCYNNRCDGIWKEYLEKYDDLIPIEGICE